MGAINLITQPGYYYLYALYFDYPINNAFFVGEESAERLRELVWVVQRLHAISQPYRKTGALRLFTERDAMARFSPESVNEMLSQLREVVEQLGPPPAWSRGPMPRARRSSAARSRTVLARSRSGAARRRTPPAGLGDPVRDAVERPVSPYPPPPLPNRILG